MIRDKTGASRHQVGILLGLGLLFLAMAVMQVFATPAGPSIYHIGNETSSGAGTGTYVNQTDYTGGKIMTFNFDAVQQNTHWKGFAGNISGAFALADSNDYSLYEWAVASFAGEVYASRMENITWSAVTCANETHVQLTELFHDMVGANTPYDNITTTFAEPSWHPAFSIGVNQIAVDACSYSTKTWNGTGQQKTNNEGNGSQFEEVIMWDSTNTVAVFVTFMEIDAVGFDNSTYDYQLILPENSTAGQAATATPYYFFVELL